MPILTVDQAAAPVDDRTVEKRSPNGNSLDFNRITDEQFLIAADHMGLENEIQLLLRSPYRELIVQIPVRMKDGSLELFHGYRVQHNGVRGPYP